MAATEYTPLMAAIRAALAALDAAAEAAYAAGSHAEADFAGEFQNRVADLPTIPDADTIADDNERYCRARTAEAQAWARGD